MKRIRKIRFLFLPLLLLLIIGIELRCLGANETKAMNEEKPEADQFAYCMELTDKIFSDLKYFPVQKENEASSYPVFYENSWGASRSYGSERIHEGCDLMAVENVRGKYKVCSMTNGDGRLHMQDPSG